MGLQMSFSGKLGLHRWTRLESESSLVVSTEILMFGVKEVHLQMPQAAPGPPAPATIS